MTPEACQAVLRAVLSGLPQMRAAFAAGVPHDTMKKWKRRHPEFAQQLRQAEAKAAHRMITRVQMAAEKQWQAAAWYLERRYPDEWALRKPKSDSAGSDAVTIASAMAKLIAETFRRDSIGVPDPVDGAQPKMAAPPAKETDES